MADREKIISTLEEEIQDYRVIDLLLLIDTLELLKKQEAEIRQLRLALDIARRDQNEMSVK